MIVGILGLIGSGKNTAADEFVSLGWEKDSFAASLKDACAAIFGWERHLLEGITDESREFRETVDLFWTRKLGKSLDKYGITQFTPRLALQLMGTNVLRDHFHADLWLNTFEYRYITGPTRNIVISDCRFKNEIELIRRLGGTLIEVDRGKKPTWHNTAVEAFTGEVPAIEFMEKFTDVHRSEWEWVGAKTDFNIANNGSLEHLKTCVHTIHRELTETLTA